MITRRKGRKLSPVGGALNAAFTRLGLSGMLAQQRALVIWAETVGPQIAAATRPLRVRDGILFVATKSSVWSHELIFRKAAILAALEKQVGKETLSDIRFVARGYQEEKATEESSRVSRPGPEDWQQVPLNNEDKQVIEHILEPVSDPELRARIERVLAHDRRARHWKEQQGWRQCPKCGLPHEGAAPMCDLCWSLQGSR